MLIADYLASVPTRELLRIAAVGSVDDGKSTLLGRLLHDTGSICEDHLTGLEQDTKKRGFLGALDFSLLLDGLKTERERRITVDVAYRSFFTPQRKFIVADCPGHEEYIRNMISGSSFADVGIVVLDISKGVLTQSKRHSFLLSLFGVINIVVAINKMDLVNYSEQVFMELVQSFQNFAKDLPSCSFSYIPVSALQGDNVATRSTSMSWYHGHTLLHHLETTPTAYTRTPKDLRFPIQLSVLGPDGEKGYSGTLASGIIHKGDELLLLPSGQKTTVKAITTFDGFRDYLSAPNTVTLFLKNNLDIRRGAMLVHEHNLPKVSTAFEAMLVWVGKTALTPSTSTSLLMKHATNIVPVEVTMLYSRVNVDTLHHEDALELHENEIGRVAIVGKHPICFDPYTCNQITGSFILIDPVSKATVGAGMIVK